MKTVKLYTCSEKTTDYRICFDSLVTDSRCPKGAVCVWQGTAVIRVSFYEGGNTHSFRMSLKGFPAWGYPGDTTINSYKIIFTQLKPYPDIVAVGDLPVAVFEVSQ